MEKKSYNKPELTTVKLVIEEATTAVCKTTGSVIANNTNCKGVGCNKGDGS